MTARHKVLLLAWILAVFSLSGCGQQAPFVAHASVGTVNDLPDFYKLIVIQVQAKSPLDDSLVLNAMQSQLPDDQQLKAGVAYFAKPDASKVIVILLREGFSEGLTASVRQTSRLVGRINDWLVFLPLNEKY